MIRLAVLAVISLSAFAQEQTRTYTFAHTQDTAQMQQVLNMIRSMAEIQAITLDAAQRTLTASSTPGRLAFANWLFTEVDRSAARPSSLRVLDNTFDDPRLSSVKIFYPANIATSQQAQELINAVRSIAEIQICVALPSAGAIVVRAEPHQTVFAEWLVRELDGSMAGARPAGVREYTFDDTRVMPPGRRSTAARIYYPSSVGAAQDMFDLVNGVRSIAEAQRVVGFTASNAVVLRASTEQAKVTDWLVRELDQPTAGGNQYNWAGSVVRTVYLPKGSDVSAVVKQIRDLGIQRAVPYTKQRAVILRALPAQMATADTLLR